MAASRSSGWKAAAAAAGRGAACRSSAGSRPRACSSGCGRTRPTQEHLPDRGTWGEVSRPDLAVA